MATHTLFVEKKGKTEPKRVVNALHNARHLKVDVNRGTAPLLFCQALGDGAGEEAVDGPSEEDVDGQHKDDG